MHTEIQNLTDSQRQNFNKIYHCYRKFNAGSETALEASIISYHNEQGLKFPKSDSLGQLMILQYVKEKF